MVVSTAVSLASCASQMRPTANSQAHPVSERPTPEEAADFEARVVRLFLTSARPDLRFVATLGHLWHRALRVEHRDGDRLIVADFDCARDPALTPAGGPVSGGPYCAFSITYDTRTAQVSGGPPRIELECGADPTPPEVTTPGCWTPDSTWMGEHDANIRQRLAQSRRISSRIVAALYHRWSRTAVGVCAGDRELAMITFTCDGYAQLDPLLGDEARSRCVFDVLYDPATDELMGGPVSNMVECSEDGLSTARCTRGSVTGMSPRGPQFGSELGWQRGRWTR